MATVYILYSNSLDSYYIGSCNNFEIRFQEHNSKKYASSYTAKVNDWAVILKVEQLEHGQARKIESHIKRMKSRRYIENICKYPEIIQKLIEKYT